MSHQTTEQPKTLPKSGTNTAIGIYPTYMEAETAFRELRKQGFDIRRMSIVGRVFHADEFVVEDYTFCDYMEAWGKFLLIAHGTDDEIVKAKVLLRPTRLQSVREPAL